MKKILILITSLLLLWSCATEKKEESKAQTKNVSYEIERIDTFAMQSSIRALDVFNEKTVWFAGSNGDYGYTENGGASWKIDSLKYDTITPHFRSIAVTNDAVFLLSVGSPALLYKTTDKGRNWKVVYKEEGENVFYDSMDFWNDEEGIAMGDPTDGCLSVIITRDGGETWNKLSCDHLPATADGEAAFAASNSNVKTYGQHVWIVSGGHDARVFHSADRGQTWSVANTPIVKGGTMTGIFSTDFYNDKQGIIFGGDWENKEQNTKNVAITNDGGQTWTLVSDSIGPGYRSCVEYFPKGFGDKILAVGTPGISISLDAGVTWRSIHDDSYYTVRVSNDETAWLAGHHKIGKIKWK